MRERGWGIIWRLLQIDLRQTDVVRRDGQHEGERRHEIVEETRVHVSIQDGRAVGNVRGVVVHDKLELCAPRIRGAQPVLAGFAKVAVVTGAHVVRQAQPSRVTVERTRKPSDRTVGSTIGAIGASKVPVALTEGLIPKPEFAAAVARTIVGANGDAAIRAGKEVGLVTLTDSAVGPSQARPSLRAVVQALRHAAITALPSGETIAAGHSVAHDHASPVAIAVGESLVDQVEVAGQGLTQGDVTDGVIRPSKGAILASHAARGEEDR